MDAKARKRLKKHFIEEWNGFSFGAPIRFLKLEVGQVWGAVHVEEGVRTPGYSMKIVDLHRYFDRDLALRRTTYLAVKLYVDKRPGMGFTQTFWFDEFGVCPHEEMAGVFHLTKKK